MSGASPEIFLVLGILAVSLVLFVTEWVRMDVVALMVLCALALTGLVTPAEAVAGFSNPAVITVWAMFILSEGLSRAGFADIISRGVLNVAGRGEARMIAVIMLVSGGLSGFMNNIGVAALMLPVVVDVARRSGIPAPRLLMPLAYGSLLGGLTTLVGTPPNLLVAGALRDAGLAPFTMFDFTPLGLIVLGSGTAFVALVGRHLLPKAAPQKKVGDSRRSLRDQYGLKERMFMVRVVEGSVAAGKTITETGLADSAGLIIIALIRAGHTQALPGIDTRLQGGDLMLVQGRHDRFDALRKWSELKIEREAPMLQEPAVRQARTARAAGRCRIQADRQPVRHREFRDQLRGERAGDPPRRRGLAHAPGPELRSRPAIICWCSATRACSRALEQSGGFRSGHQGHRRRSAADLPAAGPRLRDPRAQGFRPRRPDHERDAGSATPSTSACWASSAMAS